MKFIALFVPVFLFCHSLGAQEHRWSIGTFGLLGKSKFTYNEAPTEYRNKFAYEAGVFGQYALRPRVGLRLGLGYAHTQGGYKGQEPSIEFPGLPPIQGDAYEANFEYANMALPISLLIDFGHERETGMYVLFGPAIQFRLSRKAESIRYNAGVPFVAGISETADRSLDLLGDLGLGFAFKLSSTYSAFVQPTLTTNIPGNVLAFLGMEKGGDPDHITAYLYGVSFGVSFGH